MTSPATQTKISRQEVSTPLRGKPASIGWLMQHELRLYWRRGKMRAKSGLILVGLMLALWSTVTFFVISKFGPDIPPPPYAGIPAEGLAYALVSVVIVFIASVMVSGAILRAVEAIYTRNDLDLLLSSPLSPWRVLVVRSTAIAVGALPLYAGLFAPPLLWMAIFSSPLWLASIVFLLTLAFVATGVALIIVNLLFRIIGPRNTRVLAQIFAGLAGAAVFLTFQYFNLGRGQRMSEEQLVALINAFNVDPASWWLFPARAITGDIPSILLWVALAAAVFPLGVYLFSRSFVSDAAAASTMGQKRRGTDVRVAAVRSGVMQSVIRKELRLVVRDPLLLSQIGLQLIYLLPIGFALLRPGGGIPIIPAAFAPALTLLSSAFSGSLIWITVSAEDAPDLITSAPVPTRLIDRAKLISAIAPVLALMTIPVIALLVRDAPAGLWATGGVLFASTASALIGLWRRNPGSRRDFVRRRRGGSILTSLGQGFVTLGCSATVGFGAYGYPWLALIPAIIALAILGALYKPAPKLAET